jgi:myo-inositol-1-phosphate synthase
MAEIRVAIAGVGNCASALVQGVEYYRNATEETKVSGLMHVNFGGYHIRDVRFVTAFEVNKQKIGKDLSDAIFTEPNCCAVFSKVPRLGVKVLPGPILDSVAAHMRESFRVYDKQKMESVNVADALKAAEADMLINYLPVGSFEATRVYAQAVLEAKCAFVNCIPEFIASGKEWS